MKISWKKSILFFGLFAVGLVMLAGAWLAGYICCELRDGLWYAETVMSSSKIKDELQRLDITIPDDARGLNYCIISMRDSTYHVSFRLERKKFDGFVRTIPERYGVRRSEKRDLPPPVSKRGNDVSWWAPPETDDAEYYSGSGQVSIIYDPEKEVVYLYCFTI